MKTKLLVTLLVCFAFLTYPVHADETLVLKSATEYDYPPFSVTSSGVADGFSVELLRAVANAMGLNVTFKIGHWQDIKTELEQGKLDVLPVVGKTEERDVLMDFTTLLSTISPIISLSLKHTQKPSNSLAKASTMPSSHKVSSVKSSLVI